MMFTAEELVRMFRYLQHRAHDNATQQTYYPSQRWYDGLEAAYETAADWIQENLATTPKETSHD